MHLGASTGQNFIPRFWIWLRDAFWTSPNHLQTFPKQFMEWTETSSDFSGGGLKTSCRGFLSAIWNHWCSLRRYKQYRPWIPLIQDNKHILDFKDQVTDKTLLSHIVALHISLIQMTSNIFLWQNCGMESYFLCAVNHLCCCFLEVYVEVTHIINK